MSCSVSRTPDNNFNSILLLRAPSWRYLSWELAPRDESPHTSISSNPPKPPSPRGLGGRALHRYVPKPPPHCDLCKSCNQPSRVIYLCIQQEWLRFHSSDGATPPPSHTEHVSSLQWVAKINKLTQFMVPLLVLTQVIRRNALLTPAN